MNLIDMKERIGYIDSMKGFAILLMVMGHVIAYQFPSWQVALTDSPRVTMIVWRIIYSFHMPLFMFCSGLFALHAYEYTWKSVAQFIWKRALTLLFPFFIAGLIRYCTLGGQFLDYWYLYILFVFVVIVTIIDRLCSLIPKHGKNVSSILIISLAVVVHIVCSKYYWFNKLPFLDLDHTRLFLFFSMGVICARYDLCNSLLSKNWFFTCALVIFGFLTYWITIQGYHIPRQTLTGCILPISAIFIFVYLFKEGFANSRSRSIKWLQDLGRHSLEIYIIHGFFLFRVHYIGDYVLKLANTGGGQTIFFVQLTTSFVSAVVIILLCYMVMNVINKSSILSQVLLGRKSTIVNENEKQ